MKFAILALIATVGAVSLNQKSSSLAEYTPSAEETWTLYLDVDGNGKASFDDYISYLEGTYGHTFTQPEKAAVKGFFNTATGGSDTMTKK